GSPGGRRQVLDGVSGTGAATGDLFGLLDVFLFLLGESLFLAPAEIAAIVPDHRGGGGVLLLLPGPGAVRPPEAVEAAFQRGQVDLSALDNGGRDDLSLDWLFPEFLTRFQVEAREVVVPVALAVGVGHVQLAVGDGGHAHQRGREPFLPDQFAGRRQHVQLAALGVEGNVTVRDHGSGGPVVLGLILPDLFARPGVKGVELVTAKTAADEDLAADHRRGGQGPFAGKDHFTALDFAILAGEGDRIGRLGRRLPPFFTGLSRWAKEGKTSNQKHQQTQEEERDDRAVHGSPPRYRSLERDGYTAKGATLL